VDKRSSKNKRGDLNRMKMMRTSHLKKWGAASKLWADKRNFYAELRKRGHSLLGKWIPETENE